MTKSGTEENKIKYDKIKNLVFCKSVYNVIYITIADNFQEYLQSLPQNEFDNTDQDPHTNGSFFLRSQK